MAFLVPFFGVLLSVLTPFMAASFGQIVWGARKRRCVLAGIATLAAVCAPAIVNASLHSAMHTEYRLIPLCAPTGVAANLIVPLSAIAVYLVASLDQHPLSERLALARRSAPREHHVRGRLVDHR